MNREVFQRPTRAIVHTKALQNNWNQIQKRLSPHQGILGVVKANGYGHGIVEVSRLLSQWGAKALGVADVSEALTLRANQIKSEILCMGAVPIEALPVAMKENFLITLHSVERLESFLSFVKTENKKIRIHVKLETGMNRLGIESTAWERVAEKLKTEPRLQVEGIFSHLSESEHVDPQFTKEQTHKFSKGIQIFEKILGKRLIRHIANSSGTLSHSIVECDWVRTGISMYGYPWEEKSGNIHLFQPVLEWKAPLLQIKTIDAGDTVGYNRTFKAKQKMKIGTVAVGYGDGFRRIYSKVPIVFRKKRVPILGIICMDMLMVDLTPFPDAKEGEDVTLLGDGVTAPNAWELARASETIPYEVLTAISSRVTREFQD